MSKYNLPQIKHRLDSIDDFNGSCEITGNRSMNIKYINSRNTYESVLQFIVHNNNLMLHMESIHKIGNVTRELDKIYTICPINIKISDDEIILQIYLLFNLHSIYKMEILNDNISVNDLPQLRDLYDQSMNIL